MYPRHIWLLSGHAGAGKDATAAIMLEVLGSHRCTIASFAAAAKDAASIRYDVDRTLFDSQPGKAQMTSHGKTVRELLIEHAEGEKASTNDPYIWAKRVATPPETADHWILSDWRFLAEYETMQYQYPHSCIHTVRILRGGPTVGTTDSYTEHELDSEEFEIHIHNSGSLQHLKHIVKELLSKYWV